MATVEKPAGSGGTYTFTLTQQIPAPPNRTIFSDAARTVVAAATAAMTGAGAAFTGTYPLTLPAGRYFLRHVFVTAGGATITDDDDELLLVDPSGTVLDRPPLFTPAELANLLQEPVSAAAGAAAELMAAGWLSGAGVDITVTPRPPELFSWALELGTLAYDNPRNLQSQKVGDIEDVWLREQRARILTEATSSPLSSVSGRAPVGCFPPAASWPDAALP